MDCDRVGVVSLDVLNAQENLAESWKSLLIIAVNQHV